jgi:hypothetical protein
MAEPITSDLALRTRFSILNKIEALQMGKDIANFRKLLQLMK